MIIDIDEKGWGYVKRRLRQLKAKGKKLEEAGKIHEGAEIRDLVIDIQGEIKHWQGVHN